MNSDDLSIRLGVSNFKELKRIIKKQTHNICNISKNKIYYDSENQIIMLPLLKPIKLYLFKKIQMLRNGGIEEIAPTIINGKVKGWQVILNLKKPKVYKKHDLVIYKKDIIPQSKKLKNLDRGHLLAESFSNAISINGSIPQPNGTSTSFFSKKNAKNIIPEFKETNEGVKGNYTQVYYEKIVNDWLKSDDFVYYEVQAIYVKRSDRVPIGIRILGYSFNGFRKYFHVFVPNYDRESNRKISWRGYRCSFRELCKG